MNLLQIGILYSVGRYFICTKLNDKTSLFFLKRSNGFINVLDFGIILKLNKPCRYVTI